MPAIKAILGKWGALSRCDKPEPKPGDGDHINVYILTDAGFPDF